MNKLTVLSAAAVAALLLVSHASAQPVVTPTDPTIGVQFDPYYSSPGQMLNSTNINGNPNQYGYQAGAVNQQYWNVANNSTGGGYGVPSGDLTNSSLIANSGGTISSAAPVLLDSNGNATSVLFDLTNNVSNPYTNAGANFPSAQWYAQSGATPSYLVAGVQISTSNVAPVTLSFANLNDSDYYNLYAYVGSAQYVGSTLAAVNLGSQTYYLMTDTGGLTGYTQSLSTSAGGAPVADYVEFTNVLGSTIDASLGGESLTETGAYTGLSGFQLQDIGSTPAAVPEPSTVWMFSLGFLGLMVHVYRRRNANARA
jgi:hypothetical protein